MKTVESKLPNLKNVEYIVYLAVWMGIFSIPFFQNRQNEIVNWSRALNEWIRITAFLIVFILNAYILVPKLLFRKKYLNYVGISFLSMIVIIWIGVGLQYLLKASQPLSMPPMNLGPGMPPMELGTEMPAPMGFKPPTQTVQKSVLMVFTDNLIISILVVAAGTTFKMMSQWLNEEGRRKDVEREQLKTELALLRHQVSPHFFMNTLNNIHSLVDINTETAKDAIIRLSTLMRYLLYETEHGQTSLKKEVEFIESYISLMELRFSSKVVISVDVPENIPDIQIPPMLFISFVENAFKHGVSYQTPSYVSFALKFEDDMIICTVKNSVHKNKEQKEKKYSGIGLSNIRKSLALLFNDNYTLDIYNDDKNFEVKLTIPSYENKMYSH